MTHVHVLIECDHLRQIIWHDGAWHHVITGGRIGGECGASSAYRVQATVTEQHNVGNWQRNPAEDPR